MAFSHRNALSTPQKLSRFVEVKCFGCFNREFLPPSPPSPPPPPPPPPPAGEPSLSPFLILMFCGLAVAFSFICYLTLSSRYRTYRTNSHRRNIDETQEDFIDEDQGPVIHHPIWLINTIGLEQSVIDSIEVFKYKKGEGLIDGSDCSVCLSEFQEDESLRLLPKCSHAFHVPCIDTWLRSHKNCPLCRAPIVKNTSNAQVNTAVEENLSEFTGMEEIPLGDSENVDLERGNNANEAASVQEIDNGSEGLEKNSLLLNVASSGVRVQSDLADHLRVQVGEEAQPMRRSVSLDSSAASTIHLAVANIPLADQERCSGSCQLVLPKKPNHSPKSAKGHKRRGSSSSISIYSRLMKSSSIGRVSQKTSGSIRRSYSSTFKFSQNRSY